jgi:tetratricopeptide (TPR) repeat protein
MAGRQNVFQQAMNQGHSAAWDQMWDKAAAFYRQALDEFPEDAQALTNLGLALIELQEYNEALECYFKAAKIKPDDPLPVEKIAQLYERQGDIEQAAQAAMRAAEMNLRTREVAKAVDNYSRVIRLTPESLPAHARLALIYDRTNEKEKAVSEYLAVAALAQELGDAERAVKSVNQALGITPNHPLAVEALQRLRDFQPLPKPARPRGATAPLRMSQVRQLNAPKETEQTPGGLDPVSQAAQRALTVLAGMLFDTVDEEQEIDTERRGLQAIVGGTGAQRSKTTDKTKLVLHLSQLVDFQTKGEMSQAAEEMQRIVDLGLDHPAAFYNLGYLYVEGGRLESAMRQLQHAMNHPDFALGARILMGQIYEHKGQTRNAAFEYLHALKLADMQLVNPEQANDLRQLYEPIIEAFQQQEDDSFAERLISNIKGLLRREDWLEQLRRARQQMESRGMQGPPRPLAEILTEARSSQVIDSISRVYEIASRGDLRSAMEEAYYALDHAPTYLPLHSLMGELLVKQGDIPNAVTKYSAVARAYSMRGEPQQAVNLYRKLLELSPAELNIRTELVKQLMTAGRVEEAVIESIHFAEAYYSLADLSMARRTYTEALRTAQQANVDQALRVKILHRMADIDLQSLDWRQAMRIFEQIRTLQPDDRDARLALVDLNFRLGQEQQSLAELDNFLAYLSSHRQEAQAVEMLEELVQEHNQRIPLRRRLADLYRFLGRKEESISQYDTIGELLLETGDRTGAIQAIETILALEPENREQYEALLQQIRKGQI